MGINKNNYEAYLLDLWEGNLSEDDKVVLQQFLDMHPELDEDDALNLLEDISNSESNIEFDKAAIQFEHINLKNHEFFFVAYIEGDLSATEMMQVNDFLNAHPSLIEKFTQFKKTKLAIETIQYPHKEKLLFGKAPILSMSTRRWITTAVAACIVFMVWISFPLQNDVNQYAVKSSGKKVSQKANADTLLDETQKSEINSIIPIANESDYSLAVQPRFSTSKVEKQPKLDKIKDEHLNKIRVSELTSLEIENLHLSPKEVLITRSGTVINTSNLLNPDPSPVSPERNQQEIIAANFPVVKKEVPTIRELTTAYLQRKNVLNDERKPDIKRIVNATFDKLNANNEAVFTSTEESNMKTTSFQLGGLKVERKTTK